MAHRPRHAWYVASRLNARPPAVSLYLFEARKHHPGRGEVLEGPDLFDHMRPPVV